MAAFAVSTGAQSDVQLPLGYVIDQRGAGAGFGDMVDVEESRSERPSSERSGSEGSGSEGSGSEVIEVITVTTPFIFRTEHLCVTRYVRTIMLTTACRYHMSYRTTTVTTPGAMS